MEDLNPDDQVTLSEMPQAGRDPGDPLAPEVEEEDNPNPPIGEPYQDVEVTGENEVDKDDNSDAESVLSDVDEDQFKDFDPTAIAIENREQIAVDDANVGLLGVHKRKRTEAELEASKKRRKEKRREKPKKARRQRDGSEPFSGGEELDGKRRKKRKDGGEPRERARKEDVDESLLTPEERRRRALDRMMDEALRNPNQRRRKQEGISLEEAADEEIGRLRVRMSEAAQKDLEARNAGLPAMHKLQLLPEVSALLNRGGGAQQSIVDPENGFLEAVRFFLEPLSDGSLPAYNIQKEIFAALPKLPIGTEELKASGLGKVVVFYTKSKRPEPLIKRTAERLLSEWMRPILKRSDDYRQRDTTANSDGNNLPIRPSQMSASQLARERALATPVTSNRARVEGGVGTYTIAPRSQVPAGDSLRTSASRGDAAFRKIQLRQAGRGGGRR